MESCAGSHPPHSLPDRLLPLLPLPQNHQFLLALSLEAEGNGGPVFCGGWAESVFRGWEASSIVATVKQQCE